MIYFQSQVDRILQEKQAQIDIFKSENERLQKLVESERRAKENAIDQILALQGAFGVSVQPHREKKEVDMPKILSIISGVGQDVESNGG